MQPHPDAGTDPGARHPLPPEASSRRALMRAGALGATTVALAATGLAGAARQAAAATARRAPLALTPACDGHETPALTEGPLFKPSSPERANLVTPAINGVRLTLTGHVFDTACIPLADALLDFWQCDQNGDYDTEGFSLRGHQYTGKDGSYRLETIVPRDYFGRWGRRAAHIHVQAQATGGPVLITQLFFPDNTVAYGRDFAAINAADRLMNRACTITLGALSGTRYTGTFDFVISTTA